MSRATPLLPLWAFGACYKANFTFIAGIERQTRRVSATTRIEGHASPYHSSSLISDYIETWRGCVAMVFGSIIGCCNKTVRKVGLNLFADHT
jgi:hypothetical protein